MRKNVLLLVILISLIMIVVTGCWDTMDISNKAFVTAIGVDKGESSKKFKVSLEIVKPALLAQANTQETASLVETAEADSISIALDEIQSRIPRLISLSHLRVMLIGEKLARGGFRDTIEFIQKYPERALRLDIMFVKEGEALDVLKASPMMGGYVTDELITMSQMEKRHSKMYVSPLNHFVGHMRATGGKAIGTMLAIEGEKIIHEGSAIFADWKLQGWLKGLETKEANWIVGEANSTVLVTGDGSKYVYRVDHSKVSINTFKNTQGQLSFVVRAKTNGMIIDEQKKDYDLTKPKNMNEMEKMFSQEITKQIKAAVYKSQKEFRVDYLGFGEALKRNNPQAFAKLDWDEVFPDIPINVEVTASVTRFGLSP